LRGELVARGYGARAGGLADGQQLAAGPLREGLHADRSEHVIRSAQLRPRLVPPVLATQPLAVQQVRAGEFDTKAGSAEPIERLTITGLGVLAVAEQGPAAGIDSLPPVGLADARASGSPVSAPAASQVCPVLLAASISSAAAHIEVYSSGACSPACRARSRALP